MPQRRRAAPSWVPPSLPAAPDAGTLPRDDLTDESLLRALRFESVDLSARVARLLDIEGCEFVGTNLAEGRLDKVSAVNTRFDRCDLANLELAHSSFSRVELTGCRITGLRAPSILMRQVMLRECLADMSAFRFATLTNVWFVDCRMQRADFGSADLTSTVFRRCDLTAAELSQVKARGAVFVDCIWDGTRGLSSLSGATVVNGSPVEAQAFMLGMAANLGITLGDPDNFIEEP